MGRVGSEQMEGISTTKGLKFCSAATRPLAAATAASLDPSSEMMRSAWVSSGDCYEGDSSIAGKHSLPQGLAAARRNWMEFPARVAACPEVPKSVSAPMAAMAPLPCSWPKLFKNE